MKSARVVFRVARDEKVRFSQGISRLFGSCPVRRTALLSTFHSLGCFGFSHIWPVPLEFCSAHAGSVHGGTRRCISVAHPNSSRFSSRASRQITGDLNVSVWYRSTVVEAVGFELVAKCFEVQGR